MLSADGANVVKEIFRLLDAGVICMPTEVPLQKLKELTSISAQNIGMAFDPYISRPLAARGIMARKCGKPVRIQLSKIK